MKFRLRDARKAPKEMTLDAMADLAKAISEDIEANAGGGEDEKATPRPLKAFKRHEPLSNKGLPKARGISVIYKVRKSLKNKGRIIESSIGEEEGSCRGEKDQNQGSLHPSLIAVEKAAKSKDNEPSSRVDSLKRTPENNSKGASLPLEGQSVSGEKEGSLKGQKTSPHQPENSALPIKQGKKNSFGGLASSMVALNNGNKYTDKDSDPNSDPQNDELAKCRDSLNNHSFECGSDSGGGTPKKGLKKAIPNKSHPDSAGNGSQAQAMVVASPATLAPPVEGGRLSIEGPVEARRPILALSTLVDKPSELRKLRKLPSLSCSTCANAGECPEYQEGYVCAYNDAFMAFPARDVDSVEECMREIVTTNMGRLRRALFFENAQNGGQLDPQVTRQSSVVYEQMNSLRALQQETRKVDVSFIGDDSQKKTQGVLSKLFGGNSPAAELAGGSLETRSYDGIEITTSLGDGMETIQEIKG